MSLRGKSINRFSELWADPSHSYENPQVAMPPPPLFWDCMTEELSGVFRTRQCERTARILRDLESALVLGDDTWKFNELEYQIGHFYLQWSFSYSSKVAVARYALNWSTKVLFNHLPINTKLETIYIRQEIID